MVCIKLEHQVYFANIFSPKVFLSPLVRPAHVSRCQAVAADITNSEKKTGLVRISGALVHTGNTGLHSGGKLDQRLGSRDCLEESLCV